MPPGQAANDEDEDEDDENEVNEGEVNEGEVDDGGENQTREGDEGADEAVERLRSAAGDGDATLGPVVRLREWLFIDGDRLSVTLVFTTAVFALLVGMESIGVIAYVNEDSVTRMAGGMIAGSLSLVTLVVSINQLILSYEFTAVGEFRERLASIMDHRRDIEAQTAVAASPAEPTAILELLLTAIRDHADALQKSVGAAAGADPGGGGRDSERDREARELVAAYADEVEANASRLDETLDDAGFGSFQALSAAIRYGEDWQLYAARQLRNRYAETLPDDAVAALDDLVETLELFTVAEESFKTTYLQRELTRFSQLTIFVGIPAVTAAFVLGFMYADTTGSAIPPAYLSIVTPALAAVVLAPLMLLGAFILRTATVSRRTASIGPLQPGKEPDEGPFDVTYGERAGQAGEDEEDGEEGEDDEDEEYREDDEDEETAESAAGVRPDERSGSGGT